MEKFSKGRKYLRTFASSSIPEKDDLFLSSKTPKKASSNFSANWPQFANSEVNSQIYLIKTRPLCQICNK